MALWRGLWKISKSCCYCCWSIVDETPRLSIRIVIWILPSDTIYLVMTCIVFVLTIQIERQQCCLVYSGASWLQRTSSLWLLALWIPVNKNYSSEYKTACWLCVHELGNNLGLQCTLYTQPRIFIRKVQQSYNLRSGFGIANIWINNNYGAIMISNSHNDAWNQQI